MVVQDSNETTFEYGQWLVTPPTLAGVLAYSVHVCRVLLVLYPLFLYRCNMLTYTYTLIYVFTTMLHFLTFKNGLIIK